MALQLLSHEISDLCIGKPALRPLSVTATVADALSLLRSSSDDPSVSVWSSSGEPPRCVGKISIIDVLYFLCLDENLYRPSIVLQSPVSLLLQNQKAPLLVQQLEPNSSLLEAVDCILEGAHSLIIPTRSRNFNSKQKLIHKPSNNKGRQFCLITEEDIIRFFFNSINLFSPISSHSIESLNIIEDEILAVHYNDPAFSAISKIKNASNGQAAVAVMDNEGRLIGEISLYTLACCDETLAPAIATLSAGDLLAYIDYGGPSDDLVQLVKSRLEEKNLDGMLELLEDNHSDSSSHSLSSSSDEEAGLVKSVRHRANSRRFVKGTDPIVCHPGSSLIAVMIQAMTHRLNYMWVVEQDYSLVGVVTFAGMLKILLDRVHSFS